MSFIGKNIIPLLVLLFVMGNDARAQRGPYDTIRVYAYIDENGDTIPEGWLEPVEVRAQMSEKMRRYWAEWTRLRNAIYVTYPYAKAAGKIMNEINGRLANVTDKKQRRAIIRSREKDLKREFSDKVKNLSVYQGKVLMKLIYRETGNDCYEIIKEYKGGFTATMWQTVAVVFGSNLKQHYDANGNEKVYETIVRDVERMYGHRM
ncbi:MAG TPA: DUF4294 domain-containing protein [Chitinophagaceae bacterium]